MGHEIAFVAEGRLKVCAAPVAPSAAEGVLDGAQLAAQESVVVNHIGRGACFGEVAVMLREPRAATIGVRMRSNRALDVATTQ